MLPRRPLVAGNWKMNVAPAEAVPLVRGMRGPLGRVRGVEVLLCPAFPALVPVKELLQASRVRLGAQDCHPERGGAYTGEVSARMLAGLCSHVIVGHSERRAMFGDTDPLVRRKVAAVVGAGMVPVLCVGETDEENRRGATGEVVATQVAAALDGLGVAPGRVVVAYEPVWAIGSGRACEPGMANRVCGLVIRSTLAELGGEALASGVRVLYGGSVGPMNATAYFSQPDIDGALVGGAALKAETFVPIVEAAAVRVVGG